MTAYHACPMRIYWNAVRSVWIFQHGHNPEHYVELPTERIARISNALLERFIRRWVFRVHRYEDEQ